MLSTSIKTSQLPCLPRPHKVSLRRPRVCTAAIKPQATGGDHQPVFHALVDALRREARQNPAPSEGFDARQHVMVAVTRYNGAEQVLQRARQANNSARAQAKARKRVIFELTVLNHALQRWRTGELGQSPTPSTAALAELVEAATLLRRHEFSHLVATLPPAEESREGVVGWLLEEILEPVDRRLTPTASSWLQTARSVMTEVALSERALAAALPSDKPAALHALRSALAALRDELTEQQRILEGNLWFSFAAMARIYVTRRDAELACMQADYLG